MNKYYTTHDARSTPENAYSIHRRKEKFFHEGRRKDFQKTKNPGEKKEFSEANGSSGKLTKVRLDKLIICTPNNG